MADAKLFYAYSSEVMSFSLAGTERPAPAAEPVTEDVAEQADRLLRLLQKSRKQAIVLFGLGSGALAAELDRTLPGGTSLFICDLFPERARNLAEAGKLKWFTPQGRTQLIADTSPWAHLHLLAQDRVTADSALLSLNPEAGGDERDTLKELQRLLTRGKQKQAINGTPFGHFAVQAPSVSVGCILSPDEPGLDHFFAQFPDWVEEVVVVWDAETVPERDIRAACPVKQLAHPLDGDFSAQRNRMLEACSAQWVLVLDADESFDDGIWTMLPGLLPVRDAMGWWFPRQTFCPDESSYRVGLGLWPDLQLRLFRNVDGLKYENPVHERLTGVSGRVGIVLDAPIEHHSFIRKDAEAWQRKLAVFDQASGGKVSHALNEEYPHLPVVRSRKANILCNELSVLLLPDNPA